MIAALNQPGSYFTTLQHLYVLPLVTFRMGLSEFRFAYETYRTLILFFDRHVRTLTYSILAQAYPRSSGQPQKTAAVSAESV